MKRKLGRILALALALSVMLSVTAFASNGTDPTVTVVTDAATAAFNGTSFEDLTVTYDAGADYAGKDYMIWVLAVDAEGVFVTPTKDNADEAVLYVWQETADSNGKVTFSKVFPREIVNSAIVVSGPDTNGLKEIATIKVPYILGDINMDGFVDTKDLTRLARYLVGAQVEINLKAADVNCDNDINVKDLTRLARFLVGGANLG